MLTVRAKETGLLLQGRTFYQLEEARDEEALVSGQEPRPLGQPRGWVSATSASCPSLSLGDSGDSLY